MKTMQHYLILINLSALAITSAGAAEYLPVCEKCLNPRVVSKSGTGTANATAEARVLTEDAAAWCAANRPHDAYCAREEVKNGGDGGRKSYTGSADCVAGVLHSINGGDYLYAGVWPDGAGRGRAMLKDPQGNVPGWNSVTSGYGVARREWARFAGYSLTGQWEVLCGKAAVAAATPAKARAATPAASRASRTGESTATVSGEWLASCFRCPAPNVISKSGIGSAQAKAEARMTADALKESCAETDPQDIAGCVRREMADSGRKIYRASANCSTGSITTIDDQTYTLAGVWDNSDIGAGRTKWRGADGQIVGRDNASNGLAISQQWEVLCPGPVNPSLLAQARSVNSRPQSSGASIERPGATASASSVCAGERYCEETGSFAAIVRDLRLSTISRSERAVSATIKFLNKSRRPLILGYVRNGAVAIDEQGNRYVLASPASVRGIGEIGGREFDPKFTLQPGETAEARFEFVWQWNGREIIGTRAWDVELAVREANEVGPGQYRFGQEHVLAFRTVAPASAITQSVEAQPLQQTAVQQTAVQHAAVPDPPANMVSAESAAPSADACVGKKGCYDAGAFVAEIRQATLTHEGNFQDRVVRLNIQFHNTGSQPLTLAYVAQSSVLVDNLGNRFYWGTAGTYDMSAAGIGKLEGRKADPQFTLAPGESRPATFTLRRARPPKTDPDANVYTYNVTLAQLEVLYNGQQVRTTREHTLTFADFAINAGGGGSMRPTGTNAQENFQQIGDAIRRAWRKKH